VQSIAHPTTPALYAQPSSFDQAAQAQQQQEYLLAARAAEELAAEVQAKEEKISKQQEHFAAMQVRLCLQTCVVESGWLLHTAGKVSREHLTVLSYNITSESCLSHPVPYLYTLKPHQTLCKEPIHARILYRRDAAPTSHHLSLKTFQIAAKQHTPEDDRGTTSVLKLPLHCSTPCGRRRSDCGPCSGTMCCSWRWWPARCQTIPPWNGACRRPHPGLGCSATSTTWPLQVNCTARSGDGCLRAVQLPRQKTPQGCPWGGFDGWQAI